MGEKVSDEKIPPVQSEECSECSNSETVSLLQGADTTCAIREHQPGGHRPAVSIADLPSYLTTCPKFSACETKKKEPPLRFDGRNNVRGNLYVAFVITCFAGSSLGAIFINKTCLTGYNFHYPLTLILGQMVFAVGLLLLLHKAGYREIPSAGRQELLAMAFPTVLFIGNVVVGLSALSLVNIPMFSAFRRLTLLFVMVAEFVFLGKMHTKGIVGAVTIMTFGAFISALDDVAFSKMGYFLVLMNNILTACYLASIKKTMRETGFDPLALLFYTALLGTPVVVMLQICTGELSHVVHAFNTQEILRTWGFVMSLLLTASGAFAVNFSTTLCTNVTSPLTTSVAGQVKNILQTILGCFSWGFVPTITNIAGLFIAVCAQIWFAILKYYENHAESKEEEDSRMSDFVSSNVWSYGSAKGKSYSEAYLYNRVHRS